jgi:hypothetical protein
MTSNTSRVTRAQVPPGTIDIVRAFACPVCCSFAPFESRRCPNCLAELGLHIPTKTMVATSSGGAIIDGQHWVVCTKAASLGCNWLVPEEQESGVQRGRCLPDSLIRREPEADDTIAVEKRGAAALDLPAYRCRPSCRSVLEP